MITKYFNAKQIIYEYYKIVYPGKYNDAQIAAKQWSNEKKNNYAKIDKAILQQVINKIYDEQLLILST
jgi:hypothetical protein